jgi:lipopolysaccharide export system permease protein
MKTLHLYITRQVLTALGMTVAVFTFVLLLGNILKEIIALLIAGQITFPLVLKAVGLLLPYSMVYVLPIGLLTAVLLVMGRFSADQELTVVRASGTSLLAIVVPVIGLSALLCVLCAVFNLWVGPHCRTAYKNLIFEVGTKSISNLITEDRFIEEIPGIILYVRKRHGDDLEEVRLYEIEKNHIKRRTTADRGKIIYDPAGQKISFALFDAITEYKKDEPSIDPSFIGPPAPRDPDEWGTARGHRFDLPPIDLTPLLNSDRKPKLSEMDHWQLERELKDLNAKGVETMPVRVQIQRQIAFSFACFAFTLLGIPLGIQAHRRETSIGVAISLGLVLVYYTFIIAAEALQAKEYLHPQLIVWIPNYLFEILGVWLLWRANKT